MKKLFIMGIVLSLFSLSLNAQESMKKQDMKNSKDMKQSMSMAMSFKGYLVDKMCATGMVKGDAAMADQKGKKHTKACALEEDCVGSGFGIIMDGKYLKFDEAGDKLAVDFFTKSDKKSDFLVQVTGTQDGNMLKVKTISDASMEMMKKDGMMKDDMKKDGMKKDGMKKDDMKKDGMMNDKKK